jgi:hypothetical protein
MLRKIILTFSIQKIANYQTYYIKFEKSLAEKLYHKQDVEKTILEIPKKYLSTGG